MSCPLQIHPPKCHLRLTSSPITTLQTISRISCAATMEHGPYFQALHTGPVRVSACATTSLPSLPVFHFMLQQHQPASFFLMNGSSLSFLYPFSYFPGNYYLLLKIQPKSQRLQNSSLNYLSLWSPPHHPD